MCGGPFARCVEQLFLMQHAGDDGDLPSATRLLSQCAKRAVEALKPLAEATPEEVHEIYKRTSDSDRWLLRSMYVREAVITVGVAVATLRLALPYRTQPLTSALVAASAGTLASFVDIASTMPRVVQDMLASTEGSSIADIIVCPAVSEFEPCAADASCRALLETEQPTLSACLKLCRSRRNLLRQALQASNNVGAGEEPWRGARDGATDWVAADSEAAESTVPHSWATPTPVEKLPEPAEEPTRSNNDNMSTAAPSSSWDHVRAQYRERQQSGRLANEDKDLEPVPSLPEGRALAREAPRRKNAYGDDVL